MAPQFLPSDSLQSQSSQPSSAPIPTSIQIPHLDVDAQARDALLALAQNATSASSFLNMRFPDQTSRLRTLRRGSFPRAYSIVQSVVLARSVMREIGLMELGEPPAKFHVNEALLVAWQDIMVWSSTGKDRTEKTFKNHLAMVRHHLCFSDLPLMNLL